MTFVVTMLMMSEIFYPKSIQIFVSEAVQKSAGRAKVKQYEDYIAPPYLSRFSSVFLFQMYFSNSVNVFFYIF